MLVLILKNDDGDLTAVTGSRRIPQCHELLARFEEALQCRGRSQMFAPPRTDKKWERHQLMGGFRRVPCPLCCFPSCGWVKSPAIVTPDGKYQRGI